MKLAKALLLAGVAALATGCYHQVVNTGRPPAPTTVNKAWTATWLWGLVPAKAIDVTQQCPGGIATVSTQQTVPNGLATIFTLGVYTPRAVTVQCAQAVGGNSPQPIDIAAGSSDDAREDALRKAVALSERIGRPVLVRF